MKKPYLVLVVLLLIASLATTTSAATDFSDDDFTPLNNKDVLAMVQHHIDAEAIINAIKASPCTFDTFPPVLREMKRRGVPDVVLKAMVEAPYGPSVKGSSRDDLGEAPIYHYAEQLKQMGFLTPLATGRGFQPARQARARSSSRSRQAF